MELTGLFIMFGIVTLGVAALLVFWGAQRAFRAWGFAMLVCLAVLVPLIILMETARGGWFPGIEYALAALVLVPLTYIVTFLSVLHRQPKKISGTDNGRDLQRYG